MSDVLIVGGGAIGCAIAFELACRGVSVTVLDRSTAGAEASSAAAGILGAQLEAHGHGPLFDLMLASRSRHAELDARLREMVGFGSGFRRCGAIEVGDPEDLHRAYDWQGASVIGPADIHALEPELVASSGVYLPDEAQLDPRELVRSLREAGMVKGVIYRDGTAVQSVGPRSVRTAETTFEADAVVIAAGSWSSALEGLPSDLRTVRPIRGQIVEVTTRPPILRHIVMGPRGYIVPRADGRTLLGSTMEDVGHVKAVTASGIRDVLEQALALVPALQDAPLAATWAGFRPLASATGMPMIGCAQGIWVATGHHRNGILLSAETAQIVASLIVDGRCERDLQPFSPLGSKP